DLARLPLVARLAEVGDVGRGAHKPVGLDAHQIGIAGAEADADDPSHSYSFRLASALTAATVMAEPPRRPLTMTEGAGRSCISASLDSAAPTNPTGQPMIAAGRGQDPPSSMFKRWKSAVGALPMATTAPSRYGRQSSSAAAERVLPISFAIAGTRGSCRVQITSFPAGRRGRVIPSLTIRASHRIGAPASSAARAAIAMPGEKRM